MGEKCGDDPLGSGTWKTSESPNILSTGQDPSRTSTDGYFCHSPYPWSALLCPEFCSLPTYSVPVSTFVGNNDDLENPQGRVRREWRV